MRKTAKHLYKRPADVAWMLDIIATMDENHEYFKKDYTKPKKAIAEDDELIPNMVNNNDAFYTGLPLAKNPNKKHKINLARQSKADRERAKLIKM